MIRFNKESLMKDIDFDVLCRKAEELRAIFILGQRLIPFVEDIFRFVSDIKPLLDDINLSMEENMNKMQSASRQLSKVTEATETATTEIIETINGVINKSGIIASNMKRLQELESKKYDTLLKSIEGTYGNLEKDKDIHRRLPGLSEMMDQFRSVERLEYKEICEDTGRLLNSINTESGSVIMALQVQDITSQQIAAVNHLLETIHDKLAHILMKFQSSDVRTLVRKDRAEDRTIISTLHRPIAFNTEDDDTSYFSQEDINALFAK